MVPPDSHGISRAPCYLGYCSGGTVVFAYRAFTFYGDCFRKSSTNTALCHSSTNRQTRPSSPTTPATQRLPAITRGWFSLFRFRSPLLTESRLFSLPAGNEMFHFPAFPPLALCVQTRVTGFKVLPGFPIRKSSDRSSVDSSPRLIAASYVLHRLLVPRHPPCALSNLTTKMLASTVQFSRYGRSRSSHRGALPTPAGSRTTTRPVLSATKAPQPSPAGGLRQSPRKLAPSGPNSVPGPVSPAHPQVPCSEKPY